MPDKMVKVKEHERKAAERKKQQEHPGLMESVAKAPTEGAKVIGINEPNKRRVGVTIIGGASKEGGVKRVSRDGT